jgi:hypothetical protein
MKNKSTPIFMVFALLTVFFSACCNYDKKDFDFTSEELGFSSSLYVGDTMYFESNLHDHDTIVIIDTLSEQVRGCGLFIQPKPTNSLSFLIKHLPVDNWLGTSTANSKTKIDYQSLFTITKSPKPKQLEFIFNFKGFYALQDSIIGELHTDTVEINGRKFCNYYLIKHSYPERIKNDSDVTEIYWTKKEGLIAYRNQGGEIWTRKYRNGLINNFNQANWLNGDRRIRGEMVDKMISDSILIGKSKSDVLQLLGDPTASDTTSPLVYEIDFGAKTGPLGLGGTWLFYMTVQFDSISNKVNDVWCRD